MGECGITLTGSETDHRKGYGVPDMGQNILEQAEICSRNEQEKLVAVQISEERATEFLRGSESEKDNAVWNTAWLEEKKAFLRETGNHFLLAVWGEHEEKCLLFLSDTKRVRPLEFLDYLIPDFGLIRGDVFCASVRVSSVILKLQMEEHGIGHTIDYLMEKAESYFRDCVWIDAAEYGRDHAEEIRRMEYYCKKRVAWAYVKTIDMVPAGKKLWLRSLENESGLEVTAAPDTYIMIGCKGEVYDIRQKKFDASYEMTQEPLDMFEQMMDFWPELQTLPEQEFLSIDEYAHLCYPKKGAGIYACRLEKRTKIFPAGEGHEYFLGRPGDYMAVRSDDLTDIYVIRGDIFEQTYELQE